MSNTIGWYVRVKTGELVDGVYDTILYIAGYATAEEAKTAVRKDRARPLEGYEVVGEVTPDRGPQPKPGEVRLLKGTV